jgi:hypothetical protein
MNLEEMIDTYRKIASGEFSQIRNAVPWRQANIGADGWIELKYISALFSSAIWYAPSQRPLKPRVVDSRLDSGDTGLPFGS